VQNRAVYSPVRYEKTVIVMIKFKMTIIKLMKFCYRLKITASYAHHVISCRHMAWNHWDINWLGELRFNWGLSFFTSPVW